MKPQHRLALVGLALGVLLALIIAPQTRWLVRLQVLTVLRLYHPLPALDSPAYTPSAAEDQRRYEAVAARHPNDFAIQYGVAATAGSSGATLAGLRALTVRFPDRPALYANILRYETLGNVHLVRPEENLLLSPAARGAVPPMRPSTAQNLAAYDREAAAGERLDPSNAYFPLMRAVGLFAAFRDADGLAAFRRASEKPDWRDYCADDVEARWRLHEEAFGDPGALGRFALTSSLLLPQFSQIRALARLLLVKAVQKEQAGHREEGLKLRESLRRCGDLMRVHSTFVIGALVADAICALATTHTDGMTPPPHTPGLTPEQDRQRLLDQYSAYVTRLGHPEAAARAKAEEAAGRQVSALLSSADPMRFLSPVTRLTQWWLAGIAVLSNILWLLLLGGLAAAGARTRWVRRSEEGAGEDAKAAVSRKTVLKQSLIATGIVAAAFLLADRLLHIFDLPSWPGLVVGGIETLLFLLAVFGLPPTLVIYLMRHGFHPPRFSRPVFLRGIGAALLAGSCLYGLYALILWQAGSLAEMTDALRSLMGLSGGGEDADAAQAQQRVTHWLAAAAALAIPLLLLLVSGLAAGVRRVPLRVGLVRGFRAAAVPAACLLPLAYGGLLLGTLRQERVVGAQVWHTVHDEGPYLAAQSGQAWPGPVR